MRLAGHTAIVVDDGAATGAVAEAACRIARLRGAARVVLAVPVAAPDALPRLSLVADDVVCLSAPRWLQAVGQAYRCFPQVCDREVTRELDRLARPAPARAAAVRRG